MWRDWSWEKCYLLVDLRPAGMGRRESRARRRLIVVSALDLDSSYSSLGDGDLKVHVCSDRSVLYRHIVSILASR